MSTNTEVTPFATVPFPARQYTRNKPSKYSELLAQVQALDSTTNQGVVVPVEFTEGRTPASVSSTLSKAAKEAGISIQIARQADGSYVVRQRQAEIVTTETV